MTHLLYFTAYLYYPTILLIPLRHHCLRKYFALYWCFCIRISFILLLIKWSEVDRNVKPQTLVRTFDQANSNSFPVPFIALLTYPVSICTADRSFSGLNRLETTLRRTMTEERLSSLAILHMHAHKDVTDIDGVITKFTRLKGTRLSLCLHL